MGTQTAKQRSWAAARLQGKVIGLQTLVVLPTTRFGNPPSEFFKSFQVGAPNKPRTLVEIPPPHHSLGGDVGSRPASEVGIDNAARQTLSLTL
jgi:hypothetical protein